MILRQREKNYFIIYLQKLTKAGNKNQLKYKIIYRHLIV